MSRDTMNKKKYVVFDMVKILREHTLKPENIPWERRQLRLSDIPPRERPV